jgi:hypothetical protein
MFVKFIENFGSAHFVIVDFLLKLYIIVNV